MMRGSHDRCRFQSATDVTRCRGLGIGRRRGTRQPTPGRHVNFSDYAAYYLAAPVRHLVPLGPIIGDLGLTITNTYLTAFLDHTVKSQPPPLLTGRPGQSTPTRRYDDLASAG